MQGACPYQEPGGGRIGADNKEIYYFRWKDQDGEPILYL